MIEPELLTINTPQTATLEPSELRQSLREMLVAALAATLVIYLGLSGGGYDIVVRSEIGLIIWWLVLLGALIGLLPRAEIPRAGWIVLGLLTGFLIWSWIGLAWSNSHELTLDSVCQISTYLGTLALGICVVTRETAKPLLCGLAFGITVVSGLGVLSKLTPGMFPANTAASFYATPRLSYPFDYSDGVGEFAAVGIPLLFYAATSCRTLAARAVAAAGLPVILLCLAMTVSRGGILAATIGMVAFIALMPNRIPRFTTFVIAAAGIAVLMVALIHRAALRDELKPAPAAERHSMLTIVIVVMVVSAAAQAVIVLLSRRIKQPTAMQISPRGARRITLGIVVLVAALITVAFVGGTVSQMWHSFKQLTQSAHNDQYFRLFSLAGSHRYQYWQVALKAFDSAPLIGIGPGTFRFYWAQHQTIGEYIQNAHSLWFETLAETGLVGFLAIAGFFGYTVIGGAGPGTALGGGRSSRRQSPRLLPASQRSVAQPRLTGLADRRGADDHDVACRRGGHRLKRFWAPSGQEAPVPVFPTDAMAAPIGYIACHCLDCRSARKHHRSAGEPGSGASGTPPYRTHRRKRCCQHRTGRGVTMAAASLDP